jgi:TRAP-type C4-dicarboxylate transport system permease small subunit
MQTFMGLYRLFRHVLSFMALLAGLATFAMMWLVDANVIGRRLFNAPILGTVEMAQALLVFSVMLGLPFAQANGAHLRVTIVVERLPLRVREVLFALGMLAGCALFALLAYASFGFALRSYQIGEAVWGAALRFPLWPVKGAITLGAALISIQFLLDAIRVGLFRRRLEHDDIDRPRDQRIADA